MNSRPTTVACLSCPVCEQRERDERDVARRADSSAAAGTCLLATRTLCGDCRAFLQRDATAERSVCKRKRRNTVCVYEHC